MQKVHPKSIRENIPKKVPITISTHENSSVLPIVKA